MSTKGLEKNGSSTFKFRKKGTWRDIVEISEDIGVLLRSLGPQDFDEELPESEFEELSREWEEWRPRKDDNFSGEMRKKTAQQCSLGESEAEKAERCSAEAKKASTDRTEGPGDAAGVKRQGANGVQEVKKTVNHKIRKGIRTIEKNIYEKVILKTNALYFDNCILNAVLSRSMVKNPSCKYHLEIHSNNPQMRQFFASRIDWDGR